MCYYKSNKCFYSFVTVLVMFVILVSSIEIIESKMEGLKKKKI